MIDLSEKPMKPGQLSEHFQRSEWACECGCGFDTVDAELTRVLENVHGHFGNKYKAKIRIIITGRNRCVEHNEKVQKKDNPDYIPFSSDSMHIKARACDFKVEYLHAEYQRWWPIHSDEVADYLEFSFPNNYGIGRYRGWTHLDSRSPKARWDKR
ncbi:MAG: serine/threonine protein kinase [Desulfobacteraceae bacterium]|nr:serine/threonine protein kinase [Desulfobacteraceae bacterium]